MLERGDAAALFLISKSGRIEPTNAEAHFNLATAYAALGEFDLAAETLESGLKLSPAEPLATAMRERLTQYRQSQRR